MFDENAETDAEIAIPLMRHTLYERSKQRTCKHFHPPFITPKWQQTHEKHHACMVPMMIQMKQIDKLLVV